MVMTIIISVVLVASTVVVHYYALGRLLRLIPSDFQSHSHFLRSVSILLLIVVIHLIEILWFTAGYYIALEYCGIGRFTSSFKPVFLDYFYYSLVTYTTLGLSEFSAEGYLKIITGLEALTGFILITWSATFFYTLMGREAEQ
jgi:hypothetical protein